MRSGTRSQCKSRWGYSGHRPLCKMKLGYEFCYLYAALCPATGHLIALILPDMTKASFTIFCQHFTKQVKAITNKAVVMMADGAGAHQRAICLQQGFVLQRLPTACPELNPVERFFEELRKEMSNTVHDTLESLEQRLSQVLHPYFLNKNKIIQLTNFPYLRTN